MISGGQTGVDRGALAGAVCSGFPVDGWCPRGRRAEDGEIPRRFGLRETPTTRYAERTQRNVLDSDGTVLLAFGPLVGGSALTRTLAEAAGRPLLLLDGLAGAPEASVPVLARFIARHGIQRLNVAGPRESEAPGAERWACGLIEALAHQLPDARPLPVNP